MNICEKRKYDKIGAMIALASVQSEAKNHNRREIRYYKCDVCHKYHLTSQQKRNE